MAHRPAVYFYIVLLEYTTLIHSCMALFPLQQQSNEQKEQWDQSRALKRKVIKLPSRSQNTTLFFD